MNYYNILELQVESKKLDLLEGFLLHLPTHTLLEEKKQGHLFITLGFHDSKDLSVLKKQFQTWKQQLPIPIAKAIQQYQFKKQVVVNWAEQFQKSLKPIPLSKTLSILPCPHESKPATSPHHVYIPHGLAFGTGEHATTQLSAKLLMTACQLKPQATVIDLGCGTGVLGVIALKTGAKKIIAIDNDPIAIDVTKECFKMNHMYPQASYLLDLQKYRGKVDIMVANILLNPLLLMKAQILKKLKKSGLLILSGITIYQRKKLLTAYKELKVINVLNQKGWSAILFQKEER